MTRVVTSATLDAAEVAAVLEPRRVFVLERSVTEGAFHLEEGPMRSYRRTVTVETRDDGRYDVEQEVEFRLELAYWAWIFTLPVKRLLGRLVLPATTPWWAPDDRLDQQATRAIDTLAAMAIVVGYMSTLVTQTMTFAAEEFDASKSAQGVALAVIRADVILSVGLVALSDRRGRRPVLVACAVGGCIVTAVGALAPSLAGLALAQLPARGLITATVVVIAILAAEEMPKGARAYAISLISMAGALGAGMCVLALPLADLDERAWRVLYVLPLLAIPLVRAIGRRMPESRRFAAAHRDLPMAGHGHRLGLLAVAGVLLTVFTLPASQFQNEFLRDERGYSASAISLFVVLTSTPGAIGIVVGGRLADVRGRRRVAATALLGGTVLTVLAFMSHGLTLWSFAVLASVIDGARVPAITVYGPELFPTSLRGRANGLITGAARVGSVVGLVTAGVLSDSLSGLGPALAILAVGPLLLVVLVVTVFPETAHRELEELNPEDAAPD